MNRIITYYLRGVKKCRLSKGYVNSFFDDYDMLMNYLKNDETYYMIGFSKKRVCFEGKYKLNLSSNISGLINDCLVVIIHLGEGSKEFLLNFLRMYSCINGCYAPIVCIDTDVLFFPKLRYDDTNLIKYIFNQIIGDKEYSIFYATGKKNLRVD